LREIGEGEEVRAERRARRGGRSHEEEGTWRRSGQRGGFDQSQGGFDQSTNNDAAKIGMLRFCLKYFKKHYAQ
jgi:hypothetical protein